MTEKTKLKPHKKPCPCDVCKSARALTNLCKARHETPQTLQTTITGETMSKARYHAHHCVQCERPFNMLTTEKYFVCAFIECPNFGLLQMGQQIMDQFSKEPFKG